MRIPFALILSVAIGCSAQPQSTPVGGGPGTPGPRPGPGGPGGMPPGGPGGMPPTTPGPGTPGACTTREAFASPLRRLTRVEYNNTVRDLLGDRTAPADRFPPDEVSGGFSNNAAVLGVSPLLAEKYQEAAEALAAAAVKDLPALVGCDFAGAAEQPCARQFIQRFVRRAYRRPITPAETDRLMALYQVGKTDGSFGEGIEVVLRAVLQAPAFLYRIEGRPGTPGGAPLAPLDGYEVATRLSYFLWGTMPDEALLAAAERNALKTTDQIQAEARRLLADPRARPMVSEFYRQWLALGGLDRLAKDASVYPEFNDELRAGMRAETAAFVEAAHFGSDRTLAALLASERSFVTPALARLYGVPPPSGAQPTMVQPAALPRDQRAGLLTHAGFLAVHALPDQSSPVHRGKLVREQVLCQPMPPQPPGLMVTPPEVDPRRPTRERFAQHAADPQCSTCHQLMDPIGFGFERYDGLGRFRSSDGGRAVDDSGEVTASDGSGFKFAGARELGEQLAASPVVAQCLATQWYRFAFGRLEGPGDECSLRELQAGFAGGRDLGELLVALTRTEAFRHRPQSGNGDAP